MTYRPITTSHTNRWVFKRYTGSFKPGSTLYGTIPFNHYIPVWEAPDFDIRKLRFPINRGVYIKCPVCGGLPSISVNHNISPDGVISPSVGHGSVNTGCGFHEWCKLEGWTEEDYMMLVSKLCSCCGHPCPRVTEDMDEVCDVCTGLETCCDHVCEKCFIEN